MNTEDMVSRIFRYATQIFSASHPRLFGICCVTGLTTKGTFLVLQSTYPEMAWINATAMLNPLYFIAIFLSIAFGAQYLWGQPGLSERAKSHLDVIDDLCERSKLPLAERRQIWRELLHRYIKKAAPELDNPIPSLEELREPILNFDEMSPDDSSTLRNESNPQPGATQKGQISSKTRTIP